MQNRDRIILLAAMLVTFVTGSIHCFSVFLAPFEALLEMSRASISLFYSFALVFLTLSVLFGYRIYDKAKPATLIILACFCAGLGLVISAQASNWWSVFLGYSVLFGTANGIAYGYVLQLVGRAIPDHRGFAMAAVTAAYAMGSVIFSFILAWRVETASLSSALVNMGMIIISGGILSAFMMKKTGVSYHLTENSSDQPLSTRQPENSIIALLWVAYSCAVLAGLMAIGHAAGIVQSLGGEYRTAIWGAVFIGIGSTIGGFFIGFVIHSRNMHAWLIRLPLLSALSLGLLTLSSNALVAIAILSIVGFSYGAIIAVYPFTISELFGNNTGPRIYGQVFTAWGFAGLTGPWIAGKLFDLNGQYSIALVLASSLAVVSCLVYFRVSRKVELQNQ
jgi:OFA family oxalate/formate antiporter-like MFS transporter